MAIPGGGSGSGSAYSAQKAEERAKVAAAQQQKTADTLPPLPKTAARNTNAVAKSVLQQTLQPVKGKIIPVATLQKELQQVQDERDRLVKEIALLKEQIPVKRKADRHMYKVLEVVLASDKGRQKACSIITERLKGQVSTPDRVMHIIEKGMTIKDGFLHRRSSKSFLKATQKPLNTAPLQSIAEQDPSKEITQSRAEIAQALKQGQEERNKALKERDLAKAGIEKLEYSKKRYFEVLEKALVSNYNRDRIGQYVEYQVASYCSSGDSKEIEKERELYRQSAIKSFTEDELLLADESDESEVDVAEQFATAAAPPSSSLNLPGLGRAGKQMPPSATPEPTAAPKLPPAVRPNTAAAGQRPSTAAVKKKDDLKLPESFKKLSLENGAGKSLMVKTTNN